MNPNGPRPLKYKIFDTSPFVVDSKLVSYNFIMYFPVSYFFMNIFRNFESAGILVYCLSLCFYNIIYI